MDLDLRGIVHDAYIEPVGREGFAPVRIVTPEGEVSARLYPAPGAQLGVIMVGGVGGGWDSPARGLYPRLGADLSSDGIAVLRVRFRDPHKLRSSVHDLLSGIAFFGTHGVTVLGLVGHSFGGAAVIQAAARAPGVHTLVTLATQAEGTECIGSLDPACSILVVHGERDSVLPPAASALVFESARGPKLLLYYSAGHNLDETADEIYRAVRSWIVDKLSPFRHQGTEA